MTTINSSALRNELQVFRECSSVGRRHLPPSLQDSEAAKMPIFLLAE